jgi:hypothetical protein
VNDQQLLEQGLSQVFRLFAACAPAKQRQIAELLLQYRREKESMASFASAADSASICRECAGQCCMNGKFRLNVCDALALNVEQVLVRSDFNQKPVCPYGTDQGCCLSPEFRPMDCVLFICDEIEQRLTETTRFELIAGEERIRECLQEVSRLAGIQLSVPLLLWAGRQ